jgi:hypothetical protein
MTWWLWLIIVLVVLVAVPVVLGLPDLIRYLRIRRM